MNRSVGAAAVGRDPLRMISTPCAPADAPESSSEDTATAASLRFMTLSFHLVYSMRFAWRLSNTSFAIRSNN